MLSFIASVILSVSYAVASIAEVPRGLRKCLVAHPLIWRSLKTALATIISAWNWERNTRLFCTTAFSSIVHSPYRNGVS
jgi:hypothetical protein